MRIAIITDTYLPAINGAVTSIEVFRRELLREGHQVFVLAPRFYEDEESAVGVFRVASVAFPFPLMREQRIVLPGSRFFRILKKLDVDILHSQVPSMAGVYALIAGARFGIPHIHTYHTHWMEYTHYMPIPTVLAQRAVQWISQHYCGRCQLVISPSDGMRRALIEMGVDCPIRVLPTGIDLEAATAVKTPGQLRERYPLPSSERLRGKRILAYVGRVGREKNLRFLVRTVSKLLERRNDIHFLLVGDGPDHADLDAEVQAASLGDHITMTGFIDHRDIPGVFAMADVFVTSSLTETQGLVLLEAMAVGTPVVALQAMGVSDLLGDGHGGVMCEHDESAYAAEIERLLDDRAYYTRKRSEALAKAQAWSVRNMTLRLVDHYRDAIEDYRRNGQPRFRHRHSS